MYNVILRRGRVTIFTADNNKHNYSENVFVPLVIQPKMRTGHIVICGLHDSKILYHVTS
jgi:hypothetical protein